MKTDFLPLDLYATSLKNINGINFTRREMEILAFLTSGRAVKAIASFLSISPKTVETHIHNIMLKLGCHSRESIINFIEKSDKHFCVRKYYLNLLTSVSFDDCLIKVSKLNLEESSPCLIVFWKEEKKFPPLIHEIMVHLKKAGFKVSLKQLNSPELIETLLSENHSNKSVVYYLSKNWINSYGGDIKTLRSRKDLMTSPSKVCFLLSGEGAKELLSTLKNSANFIDLFEQENYYFIFFEILKRLLPHINLNLIIEAFKENYNVAYPYPVESTFQPLSSKEENHPLPKFYSNMSLIKKKWALVGAFFFIVVFSFSILLFQYITQKEKTTFISNKDDQQQKNFVRSNLVLPMESIFLDRTELMDQIHSLLEKKEDIQSIALVGAGGSGKTTLARQYAQQSKDEIVWEINAETQESLAFSFEKLAEKLAKTEQERQSLNEFQEIKDVSKKRENILNFVTAHLKKRNHWLLIFDNVETLSEFQNLIPHDSNTWGQGKIIITTRNSNIQNYKYVKSAIRVGELTPKEKLNLFSKIMSNNSASFLPSENEEIITFLKNIPSFPLDVSISAYYLKVSNISYNKYLENLSKYSQNFENFQKTILKEAGEYTQTRHNIITLSLQKLIASHKDFKDLLLLISLIDSQNIPRNLLNIYKDQATVDNFIHHLKSYSLITHESNPSAISTFSIHRSTQAITLNYLASILGLEKNKHLIYLAIDILKQYINKKLDQKDHSEMKLLVNHCEKFLGHKNLLSSLDEGILSGELGHLYYFLADEKNTRKFLEKSVLLLNKEEKKYNNPLARTLSYLGIFLWSIGGFDEAQKYLEESLKIHKKVENKDYEGLFLNYTYSGILYSDQGYYEKSQEAYKKVIDILKNYFPNNAVKLASTLSNLGHVYLFLGDYKKAKKNIEESSTIYNRLFNRVDILMKDHLADLGNLYSTLGEFEKAKNLYEEVFIICKKNYPKDSRPIAWALRNLGSAYIDLGEFQRAKELLEQSFKIFRNLLGNDNIKTKWALHVLGKAYRGTGDTKKAKDAFEECLKAFERQYGKEHLKTAYILKALGKTYFLENNLETSEEFLQKALDIYQRKNHPDMYEILEDLSEVYDKKSKQIENIQEFQFFEGKAINCLKQALQIVKTHFPEDSPHIKRIQSKLNNFKYHSKK